MIGHLGTRVAALVDGQLPPTEAERLWEHVHQCGQCRALVEREGWVKTQLAGLALSCPPPSTPLGLRGSLAGFEHSCPTYADPTAPLGLPHGDRRRMMAVAALGAGSIGAAMVGVIALSVPAETPTPDRRNTTSLIQSTPSPATQNRTTSPTQPRPQRIGAGLSERE